MILLGLSEKGIGPEDNRPKKGENLQYENTWIFDPMCVGNCIERHGQGKQSVPRREQCLRRPLSITDVVLPRSNGARVAEQRLWPVSSQSSIASLMHIETGSTPSVENLTTQFTNPYLQNSGNLCGIEKCLFLPKSVLNTDADSNRLDNTKHLRR